MQTLRLKKYSVPEFRIQIRFREILKTILSSLLYILVTKPRLIRHVAPGEYEELERHKYEPFIL